MAYCVSAIAHKVCVVWSRGVCIGYCKGYLVYYPGYYSALECNRGCADMQCMVMAGQYYSGAVLFEPLIR